MNTDPLHGEDHRLLELQEPPPEPQLPWDEAEVLADCGRAVLLNDPVWFLINKEG